MRSLSYAFRIGHSTVAEIVHETRENIFETLSPKYLQLPDSNGWKNWQMSFQKFGISLTVFWPAMGSTLQFIVPATVDPTGTIIKVTIEWSCLKFVMKIIASLLLILAIMAERAMPVFCFLHNLRRT